MTIKIKVEDLTSNWIKQIQKAYRRSTLEIKVLPNENETVMKEEFFWSIINLLDWKKGNDTDAILAPAIKRLVEMEVAAIYQFQDLLAEKLFALDKRIFAENIGSRRYGGERSFSVDSFLYARTAVVANGEEFYNVVLREPTKMPKEFTFEPLLFLAPIAYKDKTGDQWDYLPTPSYETFSNKEGWDGKSWKDAILNI